MSRILFVVLAVFVTSCKTREAPHQESEPTTASATPIASASASASAAPALECGARRVAGGGGCVRDPTWTIEQIALAPNYACARYKNGDVRCAGYRVPAGADSLYAAIEIATGQRHVCARQKDGTVFCSGANDEGQIGDGSTGDAVSTPSIVKGLTRATAIAAGTGHTCAIHAGGKVACWGSNFEGQVEGKKGDNQRAPVDVPGLVGATQLALALTFSCARLGDGSVTCWGDFPHGRSDRGPRLVPLRGDDIAITGAAFHPTLCARAGGSIRCISDENHTSPELITDITSATAVVAGNLSICALQKSGAVACVHTVSDKAMILPVPPARSISMSGLHVCTIGVDGELACREEDGKPLDDVFRGMQTL